MNITTSIGIVSGYFDPLHLGHIDYIHGANLLCEYLIVIVNNDHQVQLKKSVPFMDETHRMGIMSALRDVNSVMISIDRDTSVCKSLNHIRKKYSENELSFFNGGDRVSISNTNSEEVELCKKLKIKYVAIPSQKRYSSSKLLQNVKLWYEKFS